MNLELVPMLIVTLLLILGGDVDVDTAQLLLRGDHSVTDHQGALIVGDASVTVPADARAPGPIYVIGGRTRIEGAVAGDVRQLAGTLVVADGAIVGGELQRIGGVQTIADTAEIARRSTVEVATPAGGSVLGYGPSVLVTLLLAFVAARRARRNPTALTNLRGAVTEHPLISLTIGALVAVTGLSLFVFMAFTLVLLPVSILGLLAGLVVTAYGVIAWGSVVARLLPTARDGLGAGAGVAVVMVLLHLVGYVPIVGDLVGLAVLLTGIGAVMITYFGLQEFRPVTLPA
jgi:hypothetical protein